MKKTIFLLLVLCIPTVYASEQLLFTAHEKNAGYYYGKDLKYNDFNLRLVFNEKNNNLLGSIDLDNYSMQINKKVQHSIVNNRHLLFFDAKIGNEVKPMSIYYSDNKIRWIVDGTTFLIVDSPAKLMSCNSITKRCNYVRTI